MAKSEELQKYKDDMFIERSKAEVKPNMKRDYISQQKAKLAMQSGLNPSVLSVMLEDSDEDEQILNTKHNQSKLDDIDEDNSYDKSRGKKKHKKEKRKKSVKDSRKAQYDSEDDNSTYEHKKKKKRKDKSKKEKKHRQHKKEDHSNKNNSSAENSSSSDDERSVGKADELVR